VACRLTHTSFAWGVRPIEGTRRLYPTTDPYDLEAKLSLDFAPGRSYMPANIHENLASRIQHNNTHQSYTNLILRSADLILASREPSPDELAQAKEKHRKIRYAPVALDAFVFIVNTKNPVRNLTRKQIIGIYTGRIKNWKNLGGAPEPIHPYQRNRNSGSQEKMERLVMKGLKMVKAPHLQTPIAMIGPFNAVRHDRRGIGFSDLYYDTYMTYQPEVATIGINGVVPNQSPIRDRSYPFVSKVYVAWIADIPPANHPRIVRDWLLSDEGQSVVAESGYVPIR
jgi:phosphate transport system substrate-binding protein